jgi:signal transduction histidine kinase
MILAGASVVLSNTVSSGPGILSILSGIITIATLIGVVTALCYGFWLLLGLARTHDRVRLWQVLSVTGIAVAPSLYRVGVGTWALVRFAFAEVPVERSLAVVQVGELPVGFLAAGLLTVGVVQRYPVFGGFPRADAVARATVVRDLREPVIIIDYDGYVLDLNASAVDQFGTDTAVVGETIATVEPTLAELDLSPESAGTTWLETATGRRQFQFSVSSVGADPGEETPIAKALLLRDVTDRRVREQRLEVFSRVLRHNLRNGLDVLLAYTHEIDDPSVRTQIRTTAGELESLGNKARQAERAMTAVSESPSAVDLSQTVSTAAASYADQTDELSISVPDQCVHDTYEPVVETLVGELLENAVEHASEPPKLKVTLEDRPAATELTVADDGPGIPDHDREVIAAGQESQHSHSTGMGLWLVRWAVTQLGGELEFADRDPTGTAVTVRLYK